MDISYNLSPRHCIIELNYGCNLHCKTCILWQDKFKSARLSKRNILNLNELKNIQNSLASRGIREITYLGGEPFLSKDLLPLAKDAKALGLVTKVVTNGSLIDRQTAEKITNDNLFNTIIFSLDGPARVHDKIRGAKGTFNKIIDAIKTIRNLKNQKKSKHPKISIYMTVSSLNYKNIKEVSTIAQKLGANSVGFQSASRIDQNMIKITNAFLKSKVTANHSYAVRNKIEIPKDKILSVIKAIKKARQALLTAGIKIRAESFLLNARGSEKCLFLGSTIILSAYGDISLCPMLPGYVIGNAKDSPIGEILKSDNALKQLTRMSGLSAKKELLICGKCCVDKISLGDNPINI